MGRAPKKEPRRRQRGSVQVAARGVLIRDSRARAALLSYVGASQRIRGIADGNVRNFRNSHERYLQEAERVRGAAETTRNPETRSVLLDIARQYETAATMVEELRRYR